MFVILVDMSAAVASGLLLISAVVCDTAFTNAYCCHTTVCVCVCVCDADVDVEEECLRQHFTVCGDVTNVRVVRDQKTGAGKGFGYVTFAVSEFLLSRSM